MEAKKPLKYIGYAIVLEEVPDEISIAFNISGCEHKCVGCHSKYLWEYYGRFVKEDIIDIIKKYNGFVTCVCFLGGDQNIEELTELCKISKEYNLKTCIYSGEDSKDKFNNLIRNGLIDYLKIGSYKEELGALNKSGTNQIMYKIQDGVINDITYRFQKQKN